MLKLFKIEPPKGKPIYFADRRTARIERDRVQVDGQKLNIFRGPDHWKGETFPHQLPGPYGEGDG